MHADEAITMALTKFSALRQQKLLEGLGDEVIHELLEHVQFKQFEKRDYVLHEGTPGDNLLMLIKGRLQIIALSDDGREVGLSFLEPGDYFGEIALIDGLPRSASVIASAQSIVGFLPKPKAMALIEKYSLVSQRIMQRLCSTVRQASQNRSVLGLNRAHTRIFAILANTAKSGHGNLTTIENLPNQHAMAIMANVSRESVSRAINALIQKGVIQKDFRRIIVRDPATLDKLARGEVTLKVIQANPKSPSADTHTTASPESSDNVNS